MKLTKKEMARLDAEYEAANAPRDSVEFDGNWPVCMHPCYVPEFRYHANLAASDILHMLMETCQPTSHDVIENMKLFSIYSGLVYQSYIEWEIENHRRDHVAIDPNFKISSDQWWELRETSLLGMKTLAIIVYEMQEDWTELLGDRWDRDAEEHNELIVRMMSESVKSAFDFMFHRHPCKNPFYEEFDLYFYGKDSEDVQWIYDKRKQAEQPNTVN